MGSKSNVRTSLFFADRMEEAVTSYVSLIPGSEIERKIKVGEGGSVSLFEFHLAGAPFMAFAGNPDFVSSFSYSISVMTEDQDETDRLWAALVEGGEPSQCGWLTDRFGITWQITPRRLTELMSAGGDVAARVQAAMMEMSKIDIAKLEVAAAG